MQFRNVMRVATRSLPAAALLFLATALPMDAAVSILEVDDASGQWGIAFNRWNARVVVGGASVEFLDPQFSGGANVGATDLRAIAAAPNGMFWVAEPSTNTIWEYEFTATDATPHPVGGTPTGLAFGLDGNLWFTEFDGNKIARRNPNGSITEFDVPTMSSGPYAITLGGDGQLWFTETNASKVASITVTGVIHEYPLTVGALPTGIASNSIFLAIAESGVNKIALFDVFTTSVLDEPSIPTGNAAPQGIAYGPDGAFWFVEYLGNKVGRVQYQAPPDPITEYPIPTSASHPRTIAAGPDGDLWFTEQSAAKLGRVAFHRPGDVNGDGAVDVSDVFYLVNFLFAGGPAPQ